MMMMATSRQPLLLRYWLLFVISQLLLPEALLKVQARVHPNNDNSGQVIIINQGLSSCYTLASSFSSSSNHGDDNDENKHAAMATVCFKNHPKDPLNKLAISVDLADADADADADQGNQDQEDDCWALEDSHLWIGKLLSELPATRVSDLGGGGVGGGGGGGENNEPYHLTGNYHHFQPDNPKPSVIKNAAQFEISVTNDLEFSCPNEEGSLFLVSLHATARYIPTNETFKLILVNEKRNTGPMLDQIIPITLACSSSSSDVALDDGGGDMLPLSYTTTTSSSLTTVATTSTTTTQQSSFLRHRLLNHNHRSSRHHDHQRRIQNCPGLYPDKVALNLTEDFMKQRVKLMIDFAKIVNRDVVGPIADQIPIYRPLYERFDGWSDVNDQALVAKTKDTQICFAVFQAVDCQDPLDQWQNINPCKTRIGDTDCIVRKGYHEAYFAEYYTEFRNSLDDCIASCSGGCQLVLGGHSQGAAAAVVGSVDLIHYNPEVITFGGPRAIVNTEPCTPINEERHFRFMNTDSCPSYDYAPFQINFFNEKQIGWPIFLDDLGNFPLATPGFGDNKSRLPLSLPLHEREVYLQRIDEMVNRNCFPLPVSSGWPDGHYCHRHDECESNYCAKKACKNGLRDDGNSSTTPETP